MKGLPIAGIAVPVQPNAMFFNVEILAHPIDDHVERLRLARILADEMGIEIDRD